MNFDSETGARVAPVLFKVGIFRDVIYLLLQTKDRWLATVRTNRKHLALTDPKNLRLAALMVDEVKAGNGCRPAASQLAVCDSFLFWMTHYSSFTGRYRSV